MAEAVSYGGGFMLNMHLDKNCQIYAYDKEIINNIGDWLKKTALRYTVPHVLLFLMNSTGELLQGKTICCISFCPANILRTEK